MNPCLLVAAVVYLAMVAAFVLTWSRAPLRDDVTTGRERELWRNTEE